MSRAHDIDNEEPLFQFDPYEPLSGLYHLEESAREPQSSPSRAVDLTAAISSITPGPCLEGQSSYDAMEHADTRNIKGKGVSQPMHIQMQSLSSMPSNNAEDLFSISLDSAKVPAHGYDSPTPDMSSSPFTPDLEPLTTPVDPCPDVGDVMIELNDDVRGSSGKGKAPELPPSFPPLSFFTTELNYESSDWPSFDSSSPNPGPSSYGSVFTSNGDSEPNPGDSLIDRMSAPPELQEEAGTITLVPSRRRSLSNLSVRSKRSISALSLSKVKVKLTGSKGPGNIARKLLFKKQSSPSESIANIRDLGDIVVDTDVPGCIHGQANCLVPWSCDVKPRTSPAVTPARELDLDLSSALRTKGRSYSSPLPLPSTALDLIPVTTTDIFKPVPIIIPNYFDEFLPRELRLQVFIALVELYGAEHQRNVRDGKWTVRKAIWSRNKWVGREKGVRELFKLSRVSKSWRTLVFDGQLWTQLDLRSFPNLPQGVLTQLSEIAGGFIRHINFIGHTDLSPSTLEDFTNNICIEPSLAGDLSPTHLITINLQGCSTLTTRSLHYLLIRSPSLQDLCLKGLTAVTSTTCDILAVYCPKLVSLNLSRCPNVYGDGIHSLASAILARKEPSSLKELRIAGLKRITDEIMGALGKAAPNLEVLDLSHVRDLHNSAVEAFVSCTDVDAAKFETVELSSREAGRDPTDSTKYRRRVTRLRHLSLSSCIMLTDHACSHLAHAVPNLEFLEMAGIGADLRDGGLVRLLDTTPFIRRLDLEDASEITDDVLLAITPEPVTSGPRSRVPPLPRPGHALEHLIISYATDVTNEALLELIENCPRLRVIEADNTRMSSTVVKKFVRLSRERKFVDSKIVAIDCRGVGEQTVKDLTEETRPRIGSRSFEARKLGYLDARDEEGLIVGQDECDELRVALKTFYSWQTVDAVRAAREKKRKMTRRNTDVSSSSGTDEFVGTSAGRARWWSPGGRRSSGPSSPLLLDLNNDREGCTIM
ncbi:hypothetical protein AcV7_001231 [Taiwanofungus camphoratus]|nr:hypothetical protein AcV7_001231 [Antrodia cinnamomea]